MLLAAENLNEDWFDAKELYTPKVQSHAVSQTLPPGITLDKNLSEKQNSMTRIIRAPSGRRAASLFPESVLDIMEWRLEEMDSGHGRKVKPVSGSGASSRSKTTVTTHDSNRDHITDKLPLHLRNFCAAPDSKVFWDFMLRALHGLSVGNSDKFPLNLPGVPSAELSHGTSFLVEVVRRHDGHRKRSGKQSGKNRNNNQKHQSKIDHHDW